MKLQDPELVFKVDYETLIKHINRMIGHPEEYSGKMIANSLLVMCMNELNYHLADQLVSVYFESKNEEVKNFSILCVGHIARVYKKAVNEALLSKIVEIYKQKQSSYWENADLALFDVNMYTDHKIDEYTG